MKDIMLPNGGCLILWHIKKKSDGPIGNTWAGLCVAECLLSVQAKADVPSVRRGWVRARARPHVMPSSARR